MFKKLLLITSLVSVGTSLQAHYNIPETLTKYGNFANNVNCYGSVHNWLKNQCFFVDNDYATMKLIHDEIIPNRIREEQVWLKEHKVDRLFSIFLSGLTYSVAGANAIMGYDLVHNSTNAFDRNVGIFGCIVGSVGAILLYKPVREDLKQAFARVARNQQTISYLKELKQLLSDQLKLAN